MRLCLLFFVVSACVIQVPAAPPAAVPAASDPTQVAVVVEAGVTGAAPTLSAVADGLDVVLAVPPPPALHIEVAVPAGLELEAQAVRAPASCSSLVVGAGFDATETVHCGGVTDLACAARVLREGGEPVELVHCG